MGQAVADLIRCGMKKLTPETWLKGDRRCGDCFVRFCGHDCLTLHRAIMHPTAWPLRSRQ